jgi:hypothetical protein
MTTADNIASLGFIAGFVQIAAIGLLDIFQAETDYGGAFHPPRTDDPRKRRRRDDEILIIIGAV